MVAGDGVVDARAEDVVVAYVDAVLALDIMVLVPDVPEVKSEETWDK